MPSSSPSDLAIAFRSFARRRREAVGDADPASVRDLTVALDQHVSAAAGALGTSEDPAAIATELERRLPEQWEDSVLDVVRRHALEAGAVLRQIEARLAEDR